MRTCVICGKPIIRNKGKSLFHNRRANYCAKHVTCSRECRVKYNHTIKKLVITFLPHEFKLVEDFCYNQRRSKQDVVHDLIMEALE